VELPAVALQFLRDLRARRREEAFEAGRDVPWILFPDLPERTTRKDETRLGHRVRRDMVRALAAAGLPLHFTPHALRHTYASTLISAGVSPEFVRRQLGHANIGVTLDLYGRWLPMSAPAGALDRLGSALESNENATSGSDATLAATGTEGGSVTSNPRPRPCPRSP
jgi:integrase